MRYPAILLFSVLLLLAQGTFAQYYETGQDPASLKWMQIKTGRFTVIYPETYGSGGIAFAKSLDEAYSKLGSIYPQKKFRIPVIIHNYTTQSNGYVAWAPRRMEIYPTPEQNSIPIDPNKQLAVHELTHVLQMESLNRGVSKALSVILGEQMAGADAALIPQWFFEGEAVFAESALTGSGRGRSPSFQKQLKAITTEKRRLYSYDKMVNGSFRNFVPDQYSLGYQLVTMSRIKYDPQIWNKALKLTANMPFIINPVNFSLLHNARITKKRLFKETFDTLKTSWTEEITRNGSKSYEPINPLKGKKYENYYSPVRIGENSVAAIKTSLSGPPEFVLIKYPEKIEEKLNVPGYIYPYFISGSQSLLVWVETQNDPRWENRNYSVIKLLDIRDKTIKQLTWKTRYMSASISPDGMMIAATENTIDNKNNLVIINVRTESTLISVPVPENSFLQRPQWSDNGKKITFISLTKNGEGIVSFKLADQTWENLIEAGTDDYQASFLRNDSLFFVSSASGTENIFVLSPEKKIFRLTSSRFGATDPLLDGGRILFCDYTSSGNNVCVIGIKDEMTYEPIAKKTGSFLVDRVKLPVQSDVRKSEYNPQPYKKWQHLIRFHSWMPFYVNLEDIKLDPGTIKPGFTIMSQNQLSTLISSSGYEYSDNRHKFHSQITWKGWYPVFESRIDYGGQNHIYKPYARIPDPINNKPELIITNRISLPLTFNSGKFTQYINASVSAASENSYMYIEEDSIYDYGQTELSARFYFSNYYRSAARDIFPRWAQIIDFNFSYYPFDKKLFGSFVTIRTALYIPGIFHNNGIKIRYENDKQFVENTTLWNRINFPRSYKNIASEDLSLFSIDYVAPLFYPDLNFLSLIYLKRIRIGLFYDYAEGTGNYYFNEVNGAMVYKNFHDYTESFNSFGFELMTDFHAFRLPYMVSAGVQAAWQKGTQSPLFELLFNIDIFGMNIGKSRM
jgi:hypothetical protein